MKTTQDLTCIEWVVTRATSTLRAMLYVPCVACFKQLIDMDIGKVLCGWLFRINKHYNGFTRREI